MLKETVAKLAKGLGDAVAEIRQDALTGLMGLGAPAFDDAIGRLAVVRREAARMGGEPERSEIRIEFFCENEVEVGFDIGGPGKARVVPKNSQLRAVRNDPPQTVVLGIQVFLHQPMGRLPPAFVAESRICFVQIEIVRGQ